EIVGREIDDGRAARRHDRKQHREHEEARLIQRALLPLTLPQTASVRLAASWQPADGVGGGAYDGIANGSRPAISIAAAAGEGVPGALRRSTLQAAVRGFGPGGADPGALCGNVNRLLCRHMVSGRFVTFCFAWIDQEGRSLVYSNAGHNPPLLLRGGGPVERL